jgi:hypothetical protein
MRDAILHMCCKSEWHTHSGIFTSSKCVMQYRVESSQVSLSHTHTYPPTYIHVESSFVPLKYFTHTHTYITTNIYTYTHQRRMGDLYTWLDRQTAALTHTYIHTSIHTYIHTYIRGVWVICTRGSIVRLRHSHL